MKSLGYIEYMAENCTTHSCVYDVGKAHRFLTNDNDMANIKLE